MSKKIDIAKAMSKITKLQESIQVILDKVTSATTVVAQTGSVRNPKTKRATKAEVVKEPRKKATKTTKTAKPEKKTKKTAKAAKPDPKKIRAAKAEKKAKPVKGKAAKKKTSRRHVELTGE